MQIKCKCHVELGLDSTIVLSIATSGVGSRRKEGSVEKPSEKRPIYLYR